MRCPSVFRGSRPWVRILPVVLLAAGCRRDAPPVPAEALPAVTVVVAPVASDAHTATEEVVGTVRARSRSVLEAKVTGRIETILAAPGRQVAAGEVLATVDAREIAARLDAAVAVREQAVRDRDRFARLVKSGAVTPAEMEGVESRLRVAAASVTEAETLLAETRVRAPFAGVVTRKLAEVGDLATPGRPLFEVEDPAALRFEADLPEALIDRVQMGQELPVRVGRADASVPGVVVEIAPVATAVSRTYLVKLDLPSAPGLRAGQFGRVEVPTGATSVPHVPAGAVVRRGQLEYVQVVTDGRARLRLVRTGKAVGDGLEILSGVEPGEQVVVVDPARVRDGQPVEVR